MLEQTYKTMNEKLEPAPELIAGTLKKMKDLRAAEAGGTRPNRRPLRAKRMVTAAAACVLVMALSVTALAAALPGFREMLFGKGSPVADSLMPVVAEGEQDGMRMEVLGAMGDETNITAYFTLQDLTGQGRVNAETTVAARARLNGEYPEVENVVEGGMARRAQILDYDEETQTALCRLDMTTGKYRLPDSMEMSDEPYNAENAKVELSVVQLWNSQYDLDFEPVDLAALGISNDTTPIARAYNLTQIAGEDPEFLTVEEHLTEIAEMTGSDTLKYQYNESGAPVVLTPREPVAVNGVDYALITGVGFIDGKLHVQMMETWPAKDFSKGINLFCTDKGAGAPEFDKKSGYISGMIDGSEELQYKCLSIAYSMFDIGEDGCAQWLSNAEKRYMEYVYDIGPDELDDYDFYFSAARNTAHRFNLRAGFDLAESLPGGQKDFGEVLCGDIRIAELTVNPIGVSISGTRGSLRGLRDMELVSADAVYPLSSIGGQGAMKDVYAEEDAVSIKLAADAAPIPVDKIIAVRINGQEIPLA